FSSWIKGPNDGKVAVASSRLEGMSDFLVLHHSHTWLQWRKDTALQVKIFLREGKFQSPQNAAQSSGTGQLNGGA
ncbi:MAG: acetyltransferase, partial [Verrucomicrobia bacterium]|nr:acetyltransferase [Verrucomicrobiota bacterium]